MAIPSSPLPKVNPAVGGPLFSWGWNVGPAGFGRCMWNFLQRQGWQGGLQRGETVSSVLSFLGVPQGCAIPAMDVPQGCTVLSGCPPGLHQPHWVSPRVTGRRGRFLNPLPVTAGFWGRFPPSSPVSRGAPRGCQDPLPHPSPFPGWAALPTEPSLPLWLVAQSFSPAQNDTFPAAFSVPGRLSSPQAGAVLSP